MNKKGFTIVELIISIILLSIVVVFMLGLMNQLRDKEDSIELDTDMILNTTFISKMVNGDVVSYGGITSVNCTTTLCDFTFNNGMVRTLSVKNNKTVTYKEGDKILLTRTIPKSNYTSFSVRELNYVNGTLRVITLGVNGYPEYNIEIVDY